MVHPPPWRRGLAPPAGTVNGGLQVTTRPDRTPELVRALVAAGVDVHEVRSFERTLEEAFVEMTNHAPQEELAS
jgi:hypothetical protein